MDRRNRNEDRATAASPFDTTELAPGDVSYRCERSTDGRGSQQPEAYIGGADKLFDAQGNLANNSTRAFMQKFLDAFASWLARNCATA